MELRKKYAYWQRILEESFFSTPNEPVLLFVDEEELSKLVPKVPDPVESLREAILDYVVVSPEDQFAPIKRILKMWQKTDREFAPPILPVLAMCVLAATKMDSLPGQRSNNYYAPLAELLTGRPDEEITEALRIRDCDTLSFFWIVLNKWVESSNGKVGFSTIRQVGNNRHVGYPLSQSILKEVDKRLLFQFFDDLDLSANQSVDRHRLMESLEKWGIDRRGFSKRFRLSLKRSADRRILEQLIIDLVSIRAVNVISDSKALLNSLEGTVHIALDEDMSECFLLFKISKPGEMRGYFLGERELRIENSDSAEMKYGYFTDSINLSLLNKGLFITNGESTFRRSPFDALVMEKNPRVQAWVETKVIVPGKSYKVLATEQEAERLQQFLPDVLKFSRQPSFDDVLGTLRIARDIRVNDFFEADELSSALNLQVNPSRLMPSPAKPQGGLKLSSNKIQNLYFVGGEPDLYFEELIPAKTYTVLVNGEARDLQVRNGNLLQLRELKLPEGKHKVQTLNSVFDFQISRKPLEMTQVSTLGQDTLDEFFPEVSEKNIQKESPMLLRRNCAKTIFLIEGGNTQVVKEPGKVNLAWDSSLTFYTTKFEVEPVPAKARYVAQLYRGSWNVKDLRPEKKSVHTVSGSLDLAHQWYLAHKKQRMMLWDLLLKFGDQIDDE